MVLEEAKEEGGWTCFGRSLDTYTLNRVWRNALYDIRCLALCFLCIVNIHGDWGSEDIILWFILSAVMSVI